MTKEFGPRIPIAIWADEEKYRQPGEEFNQKCGRVAGALTDNQEHYDAFNEILKEQRFLPGGRVQSAAGSVRQTTAFNCFVMQTIPDSLPGIMKVATDAAITMQLGGGVGYDLCPSWASMTLSVRLSPLLVTVVALRWVV